MDHNSLRRRVCEYLSSHRQLFGDDLCVVDDHYISNMSNSTVWGSAIEIKACCEFLDIFVDVQVVKGGLVTSTIRFSPGMSPSDVMCTVSGGLLVIQWTGSHYTFVSFTDAA